MNGRKARALRKLAASLFAQQEDHVKLEASNKPFTLEPAHNSYGYVAGYRETTPRAMNPHTIRYIYKDMKKNGVHAAARRLYRNNQEPATT